MVWIDSIDQLQYYNQPIGVECYCDLMVEPNDMVLQAPVPYSPSGNYILTVEVLQADGTIVFEDATDYFEWYVFMGTNGQRYMNIRAIRFSSSMCANDCFILKVTIKRVELFATPSGPVEVLERIVFQKYTERYCIDDCCLVATSITIDTFNPDA